MTETQVRWARAWSLVAAGRRETHVSSVHFTSVHTLCILWAMSITVLNRRARNLLLGLSIRFTRTYPYPFYSDLTSAMCKCVQSARTVRVLTSVAVTPCAVFVCPTGTSRTSWRTSRTRCTRRRRAAPRRRPPRATRTSVCLCSSYRRPSATSALMRLPPVVVVVLYTYSTVVDFNILCSICYTVQYSTMYNHIPTSYGSRPNLSTYVRMCSNIVLIETSFVQFISTV